MTPWLAMMPDVTPVHSGIEARAGTARTSAPAWQARAATAPALTAADHTAIHMLYAQSNLAFDSGADNGRAFARTFTADGVMTRQTGTTIAGRDQLAALAARNQSCLRTWLANLMIEPSAEGATGWAYIWEMNLGCAAGGVGAPGEQAGPLQEGGLYRDVIVRTADGWQFKTRSYMPGNTISRQERPPR